MSQTQQPPPERPQTPKTAATSAPSSGSSWGVFLRMARPRATRANAFAALLATGLGFAIATQVQQTHQSGLEQLRQDELVRILDDVSQEQGRLGTDTRTLEATRDRLLSGVDSSAEALRAAQERLDTLGILAGTSPATGTGITITITDPQRKVTSTLLLDAMQELRDAGAEAIQIGSVRVVSDTWFSDADGAVLVSGERLEAPFVIKAIGDSATMASAMDIPGGVSDSVRGQDARATVEQQDTVAITALHTLREPRYARPVPASK